MRHCMRHSKSTLKEAMATIIKTQCSTRSAFSVVALTAAIILFALCAPAQAQSMYRCGTVYQDHPCEGAQQGKVIGRTSTSQATSSGSGDAGCARRGAAAQKLVWAREGGATEERAFSEARTAEERRIVAEVYHNRGTSSEVRASVEAACVREKELAVQAGMGMDSGQSYAPSNVPPTRAAQSANETEQRSQESMRAKEKASAEAARKKSECEYLKRQLDGITTSQRSGGSAATMENLNQQQRDTNTRLSQAGC